MTANLREHMAFVDAEYTSFELARRSHIAAQRLAGMPHGSPGMEVGGRKQPNRVIAFGDFGRRIYAAYP